MFKKVAFLVIIFFVLVSAKINVENSQFDDHVVNKSKNKIISEYWQRKETLYSAQYNESGDFISFSVSDNDFNFEINLQDGIIISYLIGGKEYDRVTNFDLNKEGEILTATEITPSGTNIYEKDSRGYIKMKEKK